MSRPPVVALVVGLAMAAVLTYPTIVHPASMVRQDGADAKFSEWNVAWVAHALVDDPRHVFDANIFYPQKGALAYSEANLVAGALAAPVYAATRNPILAFNFVLYAVLVLAFMTMWALVRRLTGHATAGLVSAAGYAFSPFVSGHTAEIQLLMVFVFPLALLTWHWFVESPGVGRGAALGLTLALAGLSCGYYGIFAGLTIGLAAVWFAPGQASQQRYWLGVVAAVLVGGMLVTPALLPYAKLRAETGTRRVLDVEEARGYSAGVTDYLASPAWAHEWVLSYVGRAGDSLFPGLTISILAVVGVAVIRRGGKRSGTQSSGPSRRIMTFYWALTLGSVWASLGPKAGLYLWLAKLVPFMSMLRAPARAGVLVTFCLAVIAGCGLAALLASRRRSWLVPGLLVLLSAEVCAAPWPSRQVAPVPEVYQYLAHAPRGGVVEFHLPYLKGDYPRNAGFMFWSMWHWQPLVNGYSDYIPRDYEDIARPINSFPSEEAFAILRDHGVRYVVVHLETYNDPDKRAVFLARFPPFEGRLRRIVQTDDTWLFEVR